MLRTFCKIESRVRKSWQRTRAEKPSPFRRSLLREVRAPPWREDVPARKGNCRPASGQCLKGAPLPPNEENWGGRLWQELWNCGGSLGYSGLPWPIGRGPRKGCGTQGWKMLPLHLGLSWCASHGACRAFACHLFTYPTEKHARWHMPPTYTAHAEARWREMGQRWNKPLGATYSCHLVLLYQMWVDPRYYLGSLDIWRKPIERHHDEKLTRKEKAK